MYNLLIVDDEPLILEGLCRMIERAYGNRFLIYQSDCAEGALEIFQNSRVDLLMSDIRTVSYTHLTLPTNSRV